MGMGKFLKKHFMNKKVEIFIGDESDWFQYADSETMSYVLIVATVKDYDEECGVVTLLAETGHTFWLSEDKIEMFWEHGKKFNILKTSTSTVRAGANSIRKSRDIM